MLETNNGLKLFSLILHGWKLRRNCLSVSVKPVGQKRPSGLFLSKLLEDWSNGEVCYSKCSMFIFFLNRFLSTQQKPVVAEIFFHLKCVGSKLGTCIVPSGVSRSRRNGLVEATGLVVHVNIPGAHGKPRHWGGKGGSAPSSSNQGWQQYESTWGNRGYAEHGREIVVRVEPGEGGKCSRKIVKKEKKKHRSSYSSDFHSSSSPSTMHEKKRRNEPKKTRKNRSLVQNKPCAVLIWVPLNKFHRTLFSDACVPMI